MDKILKYENGLSVIVNSMPWSHTVSTGFWVGVGSAYENASINGLSHFTEHMMFKGTDRLTPFDIANRFEAYGANINAFTGKECTCYYVKSIDEFAEPCFELLSEIFLRSTFPKDELDKERKVIVEEINMVEDSPEDICYDVIAATAYGDKALGQTIIGTTENVSRFTGDDIRALMDEFYTPDNIVVSISGNVTFDAVDTWINRYFMPYMTRRARKKARYAYEYNNRKYGERIKPFEQSNIAISFPSIEFGSVDSMTQAALNAIMGGGMSSRLFQSLREQKGLAYSVYTAPSAYQHGGAFHTFLNISDYNTEKAVTCVREEIEKMLRGGITNEELERTKVQLKSALIFSEESVHSIMTAAGKSMILRGELYDINDKLRQINALTKHCVDTFAEKVFDFSKVCAAYVGKAVDVDILNLLK